MSSSSKIEPKQDRLPSSMASNNFEKEKSNQTAEAVTSLEDSPLKLKKEEASKPIYLTRYE